MFLHIFYYCDLKLMSACLASSREPVDKFEAYLHSSCGKSTLKEEGGDGSTYSTEQQNLMIWYTYFFLNRGKPSTHIAVLSRLSDEAIKGNIPPVLERLIETAERILKGDKK